MSAKLACAVFIAALGVACSTVAALEPPPPKSASSATVSRQKKPKPDDKLKHRALRERRRTITLLRTLNRVIDQAEFDEEPLVEVLDWFREQGIDNLIINWSALEASAAIDRQTSVSLSLAGETLGDLLDLALEQASAGTLSAEDNLTYHIMGGTLRISTRGDFDRELFTRTYYIEDLLYPITMNAMLPYLQIGQQQGFLTTTTPTAVPGGSGGEGGGVVEGGAVQIIDTGVLWGPGDPAYGRPDFESIRERELARLIELLTSVRPESWRDNGGRGTLQAFGSKLVVRQTVELHEIIGGAFAQVATHQDGDP